MKYSPFIIGFFCLTIFLFLPNCAGKETKPAERKPGEELPHLTQAEMFEDFDYLVDSITNVYTRITLKKLIMDIDILTGLDELRAQIPSINNTEDFVILINKALTLCQDMHNSLVNRRIPNMRYAFHIPEDYPYWDLANRYFRIIQRMNRRYNRFKLPLIYHKGEYKIYADFTNDGILYFSGDILTEINGIDIHNFVKQLVTERALMWDMKNQRLYDNNFYNSEKIYEMEKFELAFRDEKNKIKMGVFNVEKRLDFNKPRQDFKQSAYDKFPAIYITNMRILYMRTPGCVNSNFYINEIKEIAKDNPIEKIVMDMRNNAGGYSSFFPYILRNIYSKPIRQKVDIGMKTVDYWLRTMPSVSTSEEGTAYHTNLGEVNIPVLNNEVFNVYRQKIIWNPAPDNIDFKGKVYVLFNENTFSAPTKIQFDIRQWDNIISVGQPSGWEQGGGAGGYYEFFVLPNSKIVYQIDNGLRLDKTNSLKELFYNKVKIPVSYSWDELTNRMYYEGDIYGMEFLTNYDPVFKAVINDN